MISADRIAAIDLGSNSAHLLVAEVLPAGHIRRVTTRKARLRLAEPVARTGALGPEARDRVVEVIAELVTTARKRGARCLALVATDALRSASDGDRLREALTDIVGIPLRVLNGLEEAVLSLRGMAAVLPANGPLLGLDLGGGSLELAYGVDGSLAAGATLPLGAARLTTRFTHDPPWLAERAVLHQEALELLAPAAAHVRAAHGSDTAPPAAGTAGTIRDLGRLGLALAAGAELERVRGLVVTRSQLERGVARLLTVATPERLDLPGVSGSRVDILPAGGIVLLAAMEALELEQLQLCDWGLREGAILDVLVERRVLGQDDLVDLS